MSNYVLLTPFFHPQSIDYFSDRLLAEATRNPKLPTVRPKTQRARRGRRYASSEAWPLASLRAIFVYAVRLCFRTDIGLAETKIDCHRVFPAISRDVAAFRIFGFCFHIYESTAAMQASQINRAKRCVALSDYRTRFVPPQTSLRSVLLGNCGASR
jgi:hypothetical protein